MRKIDFLVVHTTATPQTTTIDSIQRHWREVLKWKSPGYHFIVKPSGEIVQLLSIDKVSNGVAGFNHNSIHISYIGGVDSKGKAVDNRTPQQKEAIVGKLKELKKQFPKAKIQGHRDFPNVHKSCPCFNAIPEYSFIK